MKDNNMIFKVLEHTDFGEIRTTIDTEGNPLFSAIDVATSLGYTNPRKAVRDHCKGGTKRSLLTSGGNQELVFIYEPDLYRLLVKSKLPSAQAFENWLFHEVLPSLRKYGLYANDELLGNDEKLTAMKEQLKSDKLALKLQKEKTKKLRFEKRELATLNTALAKCNDNLSDCLAESEALLEVIEPYVDFAENVLNSDLCMTATQIAADYGISAMRLNNLLHEAGLQRKVNGQWLLYRDYMNKGFTTSCTDYCEVNRYCNIQTLWTQKGRMLIHEILVSLGIYPVNMEVI